MNQAASHLADEKELENLYKMKDFYRQKIFIGRRLLKEVILAKSGLVMARWSLL